jgi:hypothetical protein
VESRPVFVDPSGRRHRVLRRAGLGAVAVLVACLGAVLVALAGGPQAPFTHWAAPARAVPAVQSHVGSSAHHRARAGVGPAQPDPQAGPVPSASPSGKASPRPRPSASPSASATPSSPVPTNPAGHTPPGKTKSPNPHRSSHGP